MSETPSSTLLDTTPGRKPPASGELWDAPFAGTRVVFGPGSVRQLGPLMAELGGSSALLVTDAGLQEAGHGGRATAALQDAGLAAHVFDDVDENPTTRDVNAGVQFARARGVDSIVALGGGSAMDTAKGINFVLTGGGRMEDYWGTGKAAGPMLPAIGMPTTAGTGSEAQSFAIIAQEKTHVKMACGDPRARFATVLLDPEMTLSLPRRVTAVAGMDAIVHAVESCVTTRRNRASALLAAEAWRLLERNLEKALDRPDDLEVRGAMLWGAFVAGAAIEASMLGAAHACANPLTTNFQVDHGVAVSLMLPHVVRFNATEVEPLYRDLLRAGGTDGGSEDLITRLTALRAAAGLPSHLRDCSVPEDALDDLAAEALTQWTAQFNPRPVGRDELRGLYEAAY